MKKLLSTLLLTAAFLAPAAANAQSSQIATLTHDGEVTLFNGSSGLINAHKAAADGDIITLSPGTFSGTTITKHITIRGAGMFPEDNGTIIQGGFTINPTVIDDNSSTTFEGLYFDNTFRINTKSQVNITKCYITTMQNESQPSATIINSFIKSLSGQNYLSMLTFINSAILYAESCDRGLHSYENCYVNIGANPNNTQYSTYKNCIIIYEGTYGTVGKNNQVFINNYILTPGEAPFDQYTSIDNTYIHSVPVDLWENDRYKLSDKYAQAWLGSDGTQVGIYGGMMPFDPTPSNPQITKFNVASKTSADGKLSVEIEVKSAE